MIETFINIVKKAYESGSSLQIPYILNNGKIVDKVLFHLLSNLNDDDSITVVSKSENKLVLEIENKGLGNLLKSYNKLL